MWFAVGNLYTQVTRATPAEIEWLRSKESGLTYANRGAYFSKEDYTTRFYDLVDERFPGGFTQLVQQRAADKRIDVQLIQNAQPAVPPAPTANVEWLRDYQLEALAAVEQHRRGILRMPTGAGKTEVAIALMRRLPAKWLVLVHRKTLMAQFAERYEARTGDVAGQIGEGQRKVGAVCTVATFQTLARALTKDPTKVGAFLAQFTGLIVDEAHTLPAESFYKVAMALPTAYYRYGISATPLDREDQRSVFAVAALGPIIYQLDAKRLIDEGHLARPIIRMAKVHQEFVQHDKDGLIRKWPWRKVYEHGITNSKKRNRVVLSMAQQSEKPCLLFVKEVDHGKALAAALELRGVKTRFVWGTASLTERQTAVKRLVRGDVEVLVSSVIFQEGVDIPELRSVVVASGGKSLIAALQRLGRGTRKVGDKTTFEVWDVADSGDGWLKRHAKARQRAYQREQFSVSVVQVTPSMPPGHPGRGTRGNRSGGSAHRPRNASDRLSDVPNRLSFAFRFS